MPGAPSSTETDLNQPRRPERANGRRTYEALLDAAEQLLRREPGRPVSIQQLAREAGVPTATAYHFFPGPVAVSVALSERYMDGFLALVARPIPNLDALDWRRVIEILTWRAADYYRGHPPAQRLILGSDHSWAIRQADVRNNRQMAHGIVDLIADKLPSADRAALHEAAAVAIALNDAVFAMSVAEHGEITDTFVADAILAAQLFMGAKAGATANAALDK
jgi:AcrR family transcriptional regulator